MYEYLKVEADELEAALDSNENNYFQEKITDWDELSIIIHRFPQSADKIFNYLLIYPDEYKRIIDNSYSFCLMIKKLLTLPTSEKYIAQFMHPNKSLITNIDELRIVVTMLQKYRLLREYATSFIDPIFNNTEELNRLASTPPSFTHDLLWIIELFPTYSKQIEELLKKNSKDWIRTGKDLIPVASSLTTYGHELFASIASGEESLLNWIKDDEDCLELLNFLEKNKEFSPYIQPTLRHLSRLSDGNFRHLMKSEKCILQLIKIAKYESLSELRTLLATRMLDLLVLDENKKLNEPIINNNHVLRQLAVELSTDEKNKLMEYLSKNNKQKFRHLINTNKKLQKTLEALPKHQEQLMALVLTEEDKKLFHQLIPNSEALFNIAIGGLSEGAKDQIMDYFSKNIEEFNNLIKTRDELYEVCELFSKYKNQIFNILVNQGNIKSLLWLVKSFPEYENRVEEGFKTITFMDYFSINIDEFEDLIQTREKLDKTLKLFPSYHKEILKLVLKSKDIKALVWLAELLPDYFNEIEAHFKKIVSEKKQFSDWITDKEDFLEVLNVLENNEKFSQYILPTITHLEKIDNDKFRDLMKSDQCILQILKLTQSELLSSLRESITNRILVLLVQDKYNKYKKLNTTVINDADVFFKLAKVLKFFGKRRLINYLSNNNNQEFRRLRLIDTHQKLCETLDAFPEQHQEWLNIVLAEEEKQLFHELVPDSEALFSVTNRLSADAKAQIIDYFSNNISEFKRLIKTEEKLDKTLKLLPDYKKQILTVVCTHGTIFESCISSEYFDKITLELKDLEILSQDSSRETVLANVRKNDHIFNVSIEETIVNIIKSNPSKNASSDFFKSSDKDTLFIKALNAVRDINKANKNVYTEAEIKDITQQCFDNKFENISKEQQKLDLATIYYTPV